MTEPLQVGQFAIVDHEPVDRGPNAGIFHGKGPADDRAELFVVAEGTTPAAEAFAGHVVSALGLTFSALDMSLTGSLQRLFADAEANVMDWNAKSLAQHRVSLGLSCFARRGEQAVVAQAGPSAVFHVRGETVTPHFPDEEHGLPLGSGRTTPMLTRVDFEPGDRVLLISTVALRVLDDDLLAGILKLPGRQVLQELYHRLSDVRDVTVLMVAAPAASQPLPASLPAPGDFVIGEQAAADASSDSQSTTIAEPAEAANFQPSLFIEARLPQLSVDEALRRLQQVMPRRPMSAPVLAGGAEMPAPLLRVSGDTTLEQLAAERRRRAHQARAALTGVAAKGTLLLPPGPTAPTEPGRSPRRRHGRHDSFSRGLVREEAPPPVDPIAESMPLVDELAAERRALSTTVTPLAADVIAGDAVSTISAGGSLVRMRGSMGGRWKGGSFSGRGTLAATLPPTWLVILVGLGALVVLVGFLTIPRLITQQTNEHYTQLISSAQQQLTTAQVQQNPALKRQELTDAQAMLLEAQGMTHAGPEVKTLLSTVNAAITKMDAVRTPKAVAVIGSLQQFGSKAVSVSRLTIGGTNAYVLDSASSQVIAMPLAGGAPKVIYRQDASKKQGQPVATAWLAPAGGTPGTLLIADQSNTLWGYTPSGGLHRITFAAPPELNITDIATNGTNLYVLDASHNSVVEFTQSQGAYPAAPTVVLQTPDLAAARRLMVDGDIVTSDATGTLHRFTGHVAVTLSEGGIDQKLVAAAAPQSQSPAGDILILDAPNNRIVAFQRDGTFAYQYQAKQFQGSADFAVANGAGYLFANGELEKITF